MICQLWSIMFIGVTVPERSPVMMKLLPGKYTAGSLTPLDDVRGEKSLDWMVKFEDGNPSPEWLKRLEAMQEILKSNGRTLPQSALAWLWARSDKAIPIPGFRRVKQVEEKCGDMPHGPLQEEHMHEIKNP